MSVTLKDSTFFHFRMFQDSNGKTWYELLEDITYYSKRHKKWTTVPKGYISDGASGPATDIVSKAWWIHDWLCSKKKWDDGTDCGSWQSSQVIYDILMKEDRWFRARIWFVATLIWQNIRRD